MIDMFFFDDFFDSLKRISSLTLKLQILGQGMASRFNSESN